MTNSCNYENASNKTKISAVFIKYPPNPRSLRIPSYNQYLISLCSIRNTVQISLECNQNKFICFVKLRVQIIDTYVVRISIIQSVNFH